MGRSSFPEALEMTSDYSDEHFRDERVTYTLQVGDQFFIIENVPARVSQRTGERLFSPETVERIQAIVWGHATPVRVLEAPVFQFAA
jgi:hypothetical protein